MNNWIPDKKKVKFAVTVAAFSAVLYAGGFFIVNREISKIENSYFDSESESYKEEKVRYIKSVEESNADAIESLRGFFVLKGDEAKFIERIELVASSSKIEFSISSIDLKASQEESFKEDVNIKMKVEGSWQNIYSFIDKLEKMSFGVSVAGSNLSSAAPGSWAGLIDIIVYREK